jgi:hypothetical protein
MVLSYSQETNAYENVPILLHDGHSINEPGQL